MASAFIKRGALFQKGKDTYLIQRDLEGGNFLIENQANGKATAVAAMDLVDQWKEGEILLRGGPGQELKSIAEIDPRERFERMDEKQQKSAWRKLKILEAIEGLPQTPKRIDRYLSEVWSTLNIPGRRPPAKTICTWRKKLRDANGDVQAIVDRHCQKGRRPAPLHPETESVIHEAISQVWLKRERASRKRVWEVAYLLAVTKNRARLPEHQMPLPTQHQVRREIKSLSAYEDFVARHGKQAARNHFRTVLYDIQVERALQEVQYDHTLLDLIVLDDRTGKVRGRPWITVCIDRLTRCIVGIWIGFAPPSYSTLAKCHRHAILPKTSLKKEYPDLVHDWEAFGVPEVAVVDNGLEFHGHNFERINRRLGTVTAMTPTRSGSSKGMVERIFKTFNDDIAHVMPGTTYSNVVVRGDYDSEKNAALTFSDLKKIVIKYIVDIYHQRPHSALGMSPAEMWRMHAPEIRLPCSVDDLKFLFDKTEIRSLSERGVRVSDLYYNSLELAQMVKAVGKGARVEVGYDPDDLQHVRVTHVETGWTLEVPAIRQDYVDGLDEWQHRMNKQWAKDKKRDPNDIEELLVSQREIDEYVQEQIARKGKGAGKRLHRLLRDKKQSPEPAPDPAESHAADDPPDAHVAASATDDYFEPSSQIEDYPELNVFKPTSPGENAR